MRSAVESSTVLVLGAGGKTGSRVVERLTDRGRDVRAASRSGDTRFDWQRPDGWPDVVRGVDAVYVTYQPELAFPEAAAQVAAFAATAVAAGVRRLVLVSGRGEEGARRAEQEVIGSGAEWTIVRCSFFAQNFSEGLFQPAILRGALPLPCPDRAEPFIDVDDIADVAVAALTDEHHAGRLYEVTGPRPVTFTEAVAEISRAAGIRVECRPGEPAVFHRYLLGEGLPDDDAAGLSELFGAVLDGRNAHVNDGVQEALGRPPRDFTDYVTAAAAAGAWRH